MNTCEADHGLGDFDESRVARESMLNVQEMLKDAGRDVESMFEYGDVGQSRFGCCICCSCETSNAHRQAPKRDSHFPTSVFSFSILAIDKVGDPILASRTSGCGSIVPYTGRHRHFYGRMNASDTCSTHGSARNGALRGLVSASSK